jgi:hypothetical protein
LHGLFSRKGAKAQRNLFSELCNDPDSAIIKTIADGLSTLGLHGTNFRPNQGKENPQPLQIKVLSNF